MARHFKFHIEKAFLNMVNMFVSSDQRSIGIGGRWFDEIENALENCAAMIVLCSPQSFGRPWINFECGAAWSRHIKIVPLCHSGLSPDELPIPMGLLQGMLASDAEKMQALFAMIADLLGARLPDLDWKGVVAPVVALEERYGLSFRIEKELRALQDSCPELFAELACQPTGTEFKIAGVRNYIVERARLQLERLQGEGALRYSFKLDVFSLGTAGDDDESEGMDATYNVFIEKKPVLQQVVEAIGRW